MPGHATVLAHFQLVFQCPMCKQHVRIAAFNAVLYASNMCTSQPAVLSYVQEQHTCRSLPCCAPCLQPLLLLLLRILRGLVDRGGARDEGGLMAAPPVCPRALQDITSDYGRVLDVFKIRNEDGSKVCNRQQILMGAVRRYRWCVCV